MWDNWKGNNWKLAFIIHNDVKPNNICWGKFLQGILVKKNQFFLIDFGYARDISCNLNLFLKKNKKEVFDFCHYEDKNEKKFQGSPQFMGIHIGKGYRPSRRTDIEELIYSLIYLFKGKLPWSHIKGKNHEEVCTKMNKIKMDINLEILFQDLPQEFIFIYKNVIKLEFAEKPEYELYQILFENVLRRLNYSNNYSFEASFSKKVNYFFKKRKLDLSNDKYRKTNGEIFEGYPLIIK